MAATDATILMYPLGESFLTLDEACGSDVIGLLHIFDGGVAVDAEGR
jgi:hypothetical protein